MNIWDIWLKPTDRKRPGPPPTTDRTDRAPKRWALGSLGVGAEKRLPITNERGVVGQVGELRRLLERSAARGNPKRFEHRIVEGGIVVRRVK